MTTSTEMGKYLAHLRDKAGLKQNELAQKVTWSPAVLSRVESGERTVSPDELNSILEAIGTEEARQFRKTAGRDWRKLPKPPLGHPNESILWKAERALQRIKELSERPDIKNVFVKRLEEFRDELNRVASLVLGTEHSVAFIGDIGVGKTTAICRVTDLEVQKNKKVDPVLEVGGGGVTVCEVHLVKGPHYGLVVEPMDENELRREVLEFASFLKPASSAYQEEETGDPDSHGTSKEIERAIRNMSGLTRKRERKTRSDGEKVRVTVDDARNLAEKSTDSNTLAVEILARIDVKKRTRRDLWLSETSSAEPLLWLKQNFEQINNGRHPEFSIPKRIEITVPQQILGEESLSIRVVDTKGIDRTAERGDLEKHLTAFNTVVVLCSSFNDAPSTSVQQLLERAEKARIANLQTKVAILVLPRPNEALAVKYDEGFNAETVDEGYELKGEQVEMRLDALNVSDVTCTFFNAFEDEPECLSDFLFKLVRGLRQRHCENLKEAIKGANDLVQNFEGEQVREIQQQATNRLIVWLQNNQQIGPFSKHMKESLLSAISKVHPSSLRASVRRQGEWYNLDYSHQLGYGARAVATSVVGDKLEEFKVLATNLLQDPNLEEAFGLVQQARRIFESGTEDLFQKAQQLGGIIHRYMMFDAQLWNSCNEEWGKGPGYRDRVSKHHRDWFADDSDHIKAQVLVKRLVEKEWQKILDRLKAILE